MNRTQSQTVGETTKPAPMRAKQDITLCTICPHKDTACQTGFALLDQLQKAIAAAGDSIEDGFEISGYAEMGGCDRPCLLAYHGTRDATHLFGDVDEGADIDALVTYAETHADALNRGETPPMPGGRPPSAVLAMASGMALT